MESSQSLINIIEEKLNSEDIMLPVPQDVAIDLSILLRKEDIDVKETVKIVEKDPSLTAKILNLSNSPVYAGLVKIKTIDQAIARLGIKTVKNFLMTIKFKDVFMGGSNFLKNIFSMNWQHSLACAICARRIAEKSNLSFIADDAYLLGLMHDIGTTPILSTLVNIKKQNSEIELSNELINEIIVAFHPQTGSKILEKFNFDKKMIEITASHHDPDKYKDQDDPLFCILQVADHIVKKVGISLNPDTNISILGLTHSAKLGLDPLFISVTEIDIEDLLSKTDNLL